ASVRSNPCALFLLPYPCSLLPMRSRLFASLILFSLSACARSAARPEPRPSAASESSGRKHSPAAVETITAEDMYRRIGVLAHDSLRGRDTPSPGLEAAAAYIARELEAFGLEPAGDSGTYFQRFPFPITAFSEGDLRFEVHSAGGHQSLRHGTDYLVERGTPAAVTAGFVFVGSAADSAWSLPGRLRDRVAVVYMSGKYDQAWRLNAGRARRAAQAAGAVAVVFALDSAFNADDVRALAGRVSAPGGSLGGLSEIASYHLPWPAAAALFRAAALDPDTLRARAVQGSMEPVPLPGVTVRLNAPVRTVQDARPPNVVALLPGSDPKLRDSYVVFSAHMDHVGVGAPDATGDSIYNGADDDASGTSALLELAQAYATLPRRPARSLIFLAVSGEEKGLLGSRYFTDNPTILLDRIVANINVDMIGRNAPDSIVVIGQEFSSLGPLVQAVAARHSELGLTVAPDLWPQERFFFRSDHFNFAAKEIPSLFFFAGVHEDYHRPSDEVETVDVDKAARVVRLIFHTGYAIATQAEPPRWTEEGLAEVRALTR
ncbi:MAG: M20/M25/M40 family metallo-hydrolase, partial [Actinomycetota bacterium]|nr:M20/M25/M40 family metallo-hydrolase [Actinomycetota bacterium]